MALGCRNLAVRQVGSCLGYSGRGPNAFGKAASDPTETWVMQARSGRIFPRRAKSTAGSVVRKRRFTGMIGRAGISLNFAGAFRHMIEDTAMRTRTLIVSAVCSILGMVAASQAQDIGDLQQGRQLALDVCASCHAVRAGQTQSPLATAPSFEEIAHMPGMTAAALTFWLTAQSHPTMPNLILSPQQVRNVSAYVLSLRGN